MFPGCVISPNVWKQRWIKRAQKYYLEIFGPVVTKEMSVKLLVQRGSKHKQIEGIKLCDKVSACKSNSVYNECLQVSCRYLILWVQQFFFSCNLLSLIVSFCGNSSPGKNPHMVKFCRASCRFWKTSTYSVYFADSYNIGTFVQASNICLSFCAYKITLFFIILLQIRSRCAKNGFPQPIICQIYKSSLHNCPIFCED